MYLTNFVERTVDMLQGSEAFEDIAVLPAYPLVKKPTKLPDTVITVSPLTIDANSISLGECVLAGKMSVRIDAFVPYEKGSPVTLDIIEKAIGVMLDLHPNALKVSEIKAIDELNCFNCSCDITVNSYIGTGEGDE
ncbi:MAG: hypothetical protein IJS03_02445 [Eubacterium sp.]|nr:hypothetical protein [Eubacterium sp.]